MPNSVAVARVRLSPSFWRSSATSARMPPSPSLSARITRATYLRETRIVIDQNTIEMIPKTSTGVGRTVLCSMLKAVCNEYSGLVPMSPKTTPSAPRVSTAFVLCPGPGGSGASGAVIAPGSVPGCPTLGSAPLLVTLEWSHIPQARTATRDPCDLLTTANGSTPLDNQWEHRGNHDRQTGQLQRRTPPAAFGSRHAGPVSRWSSSWMSARRALERPDRSRPARDV